MSNRKEGENDSRNPLKNKVVAQKKPVAITTGIKSGRKDLNLRPSDPQSKGEKSQSVDSQPLTTKQNSRGTTEGTKPDEPVSQIASDSVLADLIGDGTEALESILTPDIRFVVNQWPDLPEDTQRAILAIVRAANSQADGIEQNWPARSTKAFLPSFGEPLF